MPPPGNACASSLAAIRTQVFGSKIRNDWLSLKNNHIFRQRERSFALALMAVDFLNPDYTTGAMGLKGLSADKLPLNPRPTASLEHA